MIIPAIANVVLQFSYTVVALWYASVLICEHRKFWPFIPVFIWGVLVCTRAALLHYELQRTPLWGALDFGLLIAYLLMLLVVIRLVAKRV